MTICLVTDRHALVGAGAPGIDARACLLAQARYAIEGGVDLIQVRERDLEAAALLALVSELLAIGGVTAARIDAVASAGAAGVAAIGLFMRARDQADAAGCGATDLRATVADLRKRFDSVRSAP